MTFITELPRRKPRPIVHPRVRTVVSSKEFIPCQVTEIEKTRAVYTQTLKNHCGKVKKSIFQGWILVPCTYTHCLQNIQKVFKPEDCRKTCFWYVDVDVHIHVNKFNLNNMHIYITIK